MKKKDYLKKVIVPFDPISKVSYKKIIDGYARTSFQARTLAKAAYVWENALKDPDAVVFLCLATPMTAGGQRKTVQTCIERGFCDVIVSTGGILYQDIYNTRGHHHFIGSPDADNEELASLNIDRIYDTYVDEEKFKNTDRFLGGLCELLEERPYGSRELMKFFGKKIQTEPDAKNSFVASAFKKGVPIFCPALEDSSIGIGLTRTYRKTNHTFTIDGLADNDELVKIKQRAKKMGVVYVGGGVPKNFVEQASITADVVLDSSFEGHDYSAQITIDLPQYGGLSSCTPEEAIAWTKNKTDCKRAISLCDMTIAFPLLVGYLVEVVKKRKNKDMSFLDKLQK